MKIFIIQKFWILIFLIIFPLIFSIFAITYISIQKELVIFPNKKFLVFPYNDKKYFFSNGNSVIEDFKILPNKFELTYKLKSGFCYPYAGIGLKNNGFFDISTYDYIRIKIKSKISKRLNLYILLNIIQNKDNKKIILPYLYLMKEIPLWDNKSDYILKIKDFYVPEWLILINNLSNNRKIIKDFSKAIEIDIQNENPPFPLELSDTIVLEELSFYKDKNRLYMIFAIVLTIYYSVVLLFLLFLFYRKKIIDNINKIIIPYQYLRLESHIDEETEKFLKYMNDNYKRSDITIEKVGIECGISVYKIPVILKKRFSLSFPQYLNALRILEAKRLLKETDLNIINIAFEIGYNTSAYFNKIFKEIVFITPTEYRNQINVENKGK